MTHQIKVTNHNEFEITDYFEGFAYCFKKGEAITVPLDAMQHIFGVDFPADQAVFKTRAWRDVLFNSVSKRWGWNSHDAEKIKTYRNYCDSIAFLPVITQTVEIVADKASMPEPREQKSVTKAKPGKYAPQPEPEETSEEEVA
jgi:hypothetical protein